MLHCPPQKCTRAQFISQQSPKLARNVFTLLCTRLGKIIKSLVGRVPYPPELEAHHATFKELVRGSADNARNSFMRKNSYAANIVFIPLYLHSASAIVSDVCVPWGYLLLSCI